MQIQLNADFCKLKNLMELQINGNLFHGSLPSCLHNLTNLQVLDLSANLFSGRFPNVLLNLSSLQHLSLSDNYFEGDFSLSSLDNLSKLKVLLLSRNRLQVQIESSSWKPTFQLQALGLAGCCLNSSFRNMRNFFLHQSNLTDIDLSQNNLFGVFPTWLLNVNSKLKALYLGDNLFTGRLQLTGYTNLSLETLNISSNNFVGELPENIGLVFPSLTYFNISQNHLEGHIPETVGLMRRLKYLDLSRNHLSGEVQMQLLSECDSLEKLELSNNDLEGDIIPDFMNLPNLNWLNLNNNNFGGTIRDALQKSMNNLYFLDISNNKVTGQLPSWMGNLTELFSLSVSGNFMHGEIPPEMCLGLSHLDVSQNNFTGPVPSCPYSNYLHFQKNSLTGPIPEMLLNSSISNSSLLLVLDLRNNQLSGGIPQWVSNLSNLRLLQLGGNHLDGEVPCEICQLSNFDILDLSRNRFTGELPPCFRNMSFGDTTMDLYDSDSLESDYWNTENVRSIDFYPLQEEVEFLVKNQYLSYVGGDLHLMSGLDLSCNRFSGAIPPELGDLMNIRSMNLSHNQFSGSIPSSFLKLREIESLDLSFNNLSGAIPSELGELNFLSVFNVSYNNLTGRTPETGQFASFDQRNYLGDPGLCGSSVNKSCDIAQGNTSAPPMEDGATVLDEEYFLWSFRVSSLLAFMTTIAVLVLNPRWRGAWFNLVNQYVPGRWQ